jgi:DNA-binding Lrp family transcriptional regulator
MDAVDRKILAVLQEEGRLTLTELAHRVQLSVSPCHRRLRALERDGTIRAYRAVVDPSAVGLGFEALVFVTMRQEDRETLLGFEAAVTRIPNVLQAQRLFGDPDYLLRIVTADLAAYQRLEDDVLAALPGVQRLNSTLIMAHNAQRLAVRVTASPGGELAVTPAAPGVRGPRPGACRCLRRRAALPLPLATRRRRGL